MKLNIHYPGHKTDFLSSLHSFFVQENYSDLIFICRNNVVKGHKMIMGSVSDFLKDIIIANNDDIVYISLPDVNFKIMKLLLRYFYEGRVKVHKEQLEELKNVMSLLGICVPDFNFSPVDTAVDTPTVDNVTKPLHSEENELSLNLANEQNSDCADSQDHLNGPTFYTNQVSRHVTGLDNTELVSKRHLRTRACRKPYSFNVTNTEETSSIMPSQGDDENIFNGDFKNIAVKQEKMEESRVEFEEGVYLPDETDMSDSNMHCEDPLEDNLKMVLPFSLSEPLLYGTDKKGEFCLVCYKPFKHEGTEEAEICLCERNVIWIEKNYKLASDEVSFKCNCCRKTFNTKGSFSRHICPVKWQCDFCNYKALHEQELIYHMRNHSGNKPYSCNKCGKCFVIESELRKHKISHSLESTYECRSCGRNFCRRSAYYNHLPMHEDPVDVNNEVQKILVALGLKGNPVKN